MSTPIQRKLSARALAKDVRGFAVNIGLEDVMRTNPDWPEQRASQFLIAHQAEIAERMLRSGLQAIAELAHKESSDGR